jgi:hypothetical protein
VPDDEPDAYRSGVEGKEAQCSSGRVGACLAIDARLFLRCMLALDCCCKLSFRMEHQGKGALVLRRQLNGGQRREDWQWPAESLAVEAAALGTSTPSAGRPFVRDGLPPTLARSRVTDIARTGGVGGGWNWGRLSSTTPVRATTSGSTAQPLSMSTLEGARMGHGWRRRVRILSEAP